MSVSIPVVGRLLGQAVLYDEYKGDVAQARRAAEAELAEATNKGEPARLADALLARGIVHLLQGEPPAALASFGEIERLVPDDWPC